MRWWLVAAWVFAAVMCGVVLSQDALYVVRIESRTGSADSADVTMKFGCFDLVTERRDWATRTAYAEARADVQDAERNADENRAAFGHLARAGTALFVLAYLAPLLGLLGLMWRRGRARVRALLLLVAALAPFAALAYLGVAAGAVRSSVGGTWTPFLDTGAVATARATLVVWLARAAWACLAVVAALSSGRFRWEQEAGDRGARVAERPVVLRVAWLCAAVMCGVVVWADALYVARLEPPAGEAGPASRSAPVLTPEFGCFDLVMELRRQSSGIVLDTTRATYAEWGRDVGNKFSAAQRAALARLSRAGAGLFLVALVAPALGLLGLLWCRGRPAAPSLLLQLAALTPLAALTYFGLAVEGADVLLLPDGPSDALVITTHATSSAWTARAAWAGLAVATAVSWWRWPKRQVTPVDPGVFE